MNSKLKNYIFYTCGILLLLSAALYITDWIFIPYIYAVASVGLAIIFLLSPYKGPVLRLKRLNIQQAIAALLLPVSAYLIFLKKNEWILCLLISAFLQIYITIVRDYEEKKKE